MFNINSFMGAGKSAARFACDYLERSDNEGSSCPSFMLTAGVVTAVFTISTGALCISRTYCNS